MKEYLSQVGDGNLAEDLAYTMMLQDQGADSDITNVP